MFPLSNGQLDSPDTISLLYNHLALNWWVSLSLFISVTHFKTIHTEEKWVKNEENTDDMWRLKVIFIKQVVEVFNLNYASLLGVILKIFLKHRWNVKSSTQSLAAIQKLKSFEIGNSETGSIVKVRDLQNDLVQYYKVSISLKKSSNDNWISLEHVANC
jgi:hypothetical protein